MTTNFCTLYLILGTLHGISEYKFGYFAVEATVKKKKHIVGDTNYVQEILMALTIAKSLWSQI